MSWMCSVEVLGQWVEWSTHARVDQGSMPARLHLIQCHCTCSSPEHRAVRQWTEGEEFFFLLSGRQPIECPEMKKPEIFFESIYVLYNFTVQLPKNYNPCLQYKYNNTSILQYKCFGWVFQKTLRGIRSVDTVGYTNILSLRSCTVLCRSDLNCTCFFFFPFWRRSIFPSARKGRILSRLA